jgi:outer membrane protein assembly factor BamB
LGRAPEAAVLLLSALLLASPTALGYWTEWRGSPDNAAVEGDTAPINGVLRWKYDTGNQVLSSPVFYSGGMLIGSDDGFLYCLDPVTGDLIWKFKTKGEIQATPLIKEGRAYFGSFDRNFYCIKLPDAGAQPRKVWSYACEGQIISSAHSIGNDLVFGCLDGALYCLRDNGTLKWRTPVGNEIWASAFIDEGSNTVYIGDIVGRFVSIDGTSGAIRRSTKLSEFSESYSSPIERDGIVYVTSGIGNSLMGLDAVTLEERYRFDCGYAAYSTPAISGDRIFFGSFEYTWCVPLNDPDGNITAEEVIWSFRTHDFQGGSSPLVMEDAVIIGSDDYHMYCLDKDDGKERYNYTANGYIYSSPAYLEGAVFFGSSDWSIYAVGDPGSGQLQVLVTLDPLETTADGTVKVSVRVTDQMDAAIAGAEVSIRASAGDISFGSEGPITRADGTLVADLDPFPVSSRSTLEISVTTVSGNRSGRAKASLIVEPGLEDEGGSAKVVSPFRSWYILGIAAFLLIDTGLGFFLLRLNKKAREAGKR